MKPKPTILQLNRIGLVLGLIISMTLSLNAQDKSRLQSEKSQLQKEIKLVNSLISENKKASSSSLSTVRNLQRKIEIRQKLIRNISQESKIINRNLAKKQGEVEELNAELKQLKEEYAKMCVQHFKSRSTHTRVMFLMASENFYQAFKRLHYMRTYADWGKQQGKNILKKQEELQTSIASLEASKKEKQDLIAAKKSERGILEQEQAEEQKLLNKLSDQKKSLLADLKKKQEASNKLQREIERIIAMEMEAERKKAEAAARKSGKKEASTSKVSRYAMTPEAKALSKNFAANKNKLPWPVERGIVHAKFGKQPFPGVKGIYTDNPGVGIATEPGAKARAVYNGEVTRIQIIPGGNMVVYIRHGEYFTIYSNLSKVYVKQGDKINVKQELGEIYTNVREGKTVLDFLLYQGSKKQNPASWIYNM